MKWRSLDAAQFISDLRPLREILAERKATIAKYVPAEVQAVHVTAVADLKNQQLAANALPLGAKAPLFELADHNGKLLSSSELLAKGGMVLMFLRGRWCPFCVGQVEAMNLIAEQLRNTGVSLVAVSPQNQKQAFFMHDQHEMRFPLLVDAHHNVARQFGLVYRVSDEQQKVYTSTFVNLPFVNGDSSWELAIPATYIVDRDSTITFAFANEDYTERPEPLEILRFVEDAVQPE